MRLKLTIFLNKHKLLGFYLFLLFPETGNGRNSSGNVEVFVTVVVMVAVGIVVTVRVYTTWLPPFK